MAQIVGSYGVATFTSPSNGDTLDATVVKGNDNNLRSAYVSHDADGGLHLQSSSLATRASAGTLGRKWLTTDASSYRLFFDDGSAWYELSYLSTAGGTITGNLTVTGTITGAVTGNASTATALQTARNINGVAFNGTADITVTAAAGTLTGATLASGVTASSLTSVGTLTSLNVTGNVGVGGSLGTTPSLNKAVYVQSNTNNDVVGYSLYVNDGVNNRRGSMFLDDTAGLWGWDTTASSGLMDYVWRIGTVEKMRLDGSGNLGLGVTPSGWASGFRAFQIAAGASMFGITGDQDNLGVTANAVFDSTDGRWEYIGAGFASLYQQDAGTHIWSTAPSGTAGNAITFTQAMTLDASGNLGIGTATPATNLHVDTVSAGYGITVAANGQTARKYQIGVDANSNLAFYESVAAAQRMVLDQSGNLGLGVTPAAWSAGTFRTAMQIGLAAFAGAGGTDVAEISSNQYIDSAGARRYIAAAPMTVYQQNAGAHAWFNASSGTANAAASVTQAMTLDASGNLLVGDSSNGYGAANRGLVEINGTSDSLLGFKVGSVAKGYIQHGGTEFNIINQTATGTLALGANAVVRWNIVAAGHLAAQVDATYDIGAAGANRPRDYYGSGNSVLGGFVRVAAASAGVASTTTIGSTTAATVGAAGAASALPANPLGYIIAHVGTTQVKIPYYTA